MTVYEAIAALVQYGIDTGLTPECERIYTTNQLLEVMQLDDYEEPEETTAAPLEEILDVLLADACSRGLTQDSVVYRDLFDTKLMNALMPRPSQVREAFWNEYKESPEKATEYFYKLSQDSNYIRRYRVCKDMKWMTATEYGDLDITINLSKPEKDPKAIAAARTQKQSGYPKCLLCIQNEGYAGRVNHPARQNHRIIPITINQSQWGFQYSPYVYYNEHCIVFCGEHSPMKIDRSTFVKLFDFVGQFPHYFLGSNADLPIVGGSILTHDHFQGGHYEFAMAKAPIETPVTIPGYEDVEAGIVKWPMSVIRIRHNDRERLRDEDVREPVDSQAGEGVGLAEDDAAAGNVPAHDGAAVVPRVPDAALPELRVKTVVRVAGDEPQAYLALAAVQPRAEIAPVFAECVDKRAVFRLGAFGDYLLRIYPRVTRADPCAAFLGYYKGGVFSFNLHFNSVRIK